MAIPTAPGWPRCSDVEAILQMVSPRMTKGGSAKVGPKLKLKPGTIILAADDSFLARSLIEQELQVLQALTK